MASTERPRGIRRRTIIRKGGAIAAAIPPMLMVGSAIAEPAAAAPPAYDGQQRFIRLVGGGNGVIYAVQADGTLFWYRHLGWQTGSGGWASGSGRRIGNRWHEYRTVLGGSDGSLYGIRADGTAYYHRYVLSDATTGAGTWVGGDQIGTGFNRYVRLSGYNGVIYGQDHSGRLFLHKWDSASGTWTVDGAQIGSGFRDSNLHADDSGVIYDYRYGSIYWYRHLGNGTWAPGSGFLMSKGFRDMGYNDGVIFTEKGVLYGIPPAPANMTQNGALLQYRVTNYLTVGSDNRVAWMNNGNGIRVGTGFTVQSQAALQAYAVTPSVRLGDVVRVAVSTGFSSLTASIVRLAPNPDGPKVVSQPFSVAGGIQALPSGFLQTGCNWSDRIQYRVPAAWPAGLYAVRLEGPYGMRRYVPFVARPGLRVNPIAFLMPTFTYHAYNTWGGHGQYCLDWSGQRTLTLRRPSTEMNVENPATHDHTLWSDLLLMRWMSQQGLKFDVYDDADLHASGTWLSRYKVLVLGSHPEYWSEAMRQNLLNWQAGGGRLIYPGGNGLYERVKVSGDRSTTTFRRADGKRDTYPELGLPASQLFGTNYYGAGSYAAYRVVRDHPLLAGTGLTVGSRFGLDGYNGPASGWETDGLKGLAGEASPSQIIAKGENSDAGAAMIFMEKPNGGFVFSASSISFVGALAQDAAMSMLFRNVFNLALGPGEPIKQIQVPMLKTDPAPPVLLPSMKE